jgi:hypothetical protein
VRAAEVCLRRAVWVAGLKGASQIYRRRADHRGLWHRPDETFLFETVDKLRGPEVRVGMHLRERNDARLFSFVLHTI